MLENQIKDIDGRMQNIVQVVSTGFSNPALLNELQNLEERKKEVINNLTKEKSGIKHNFATRQELEKAYKKARDVLDNGNFHEKKVMHLICD